MKWRVKVRQSGSLLAVVALALFAMACTPPAGNLVDRAVSDVGPEGQQDWTTPSDADYCNVDPPNVDFASATFGFAQTENNNPWRIAQTESMRNAAEENRVELLITDAQSNTPKQVSDIEDMIAQGVDVLFIPPREEEGLEPALKSAREASVPVFLVDREATARICEDYVSFMGSNFVQQGERAAEWLTEESGGEAKIAELQGTVGASVTVDRGEGFKAVIDENPGMEMVASQSGNFNRAEGQNVMEQILGGNPDLNAVYAHNDEMAIGAIQALKDAGRKPGEDVTVVSVDGTRDALQAITDGDLGATVETNPRFGPLAFETARRFLAGESVPTKITVQDHLFDESNAAEFIDLAY
ncbi:MAG: ABC transporter substrate-binding protein [Actinomycetota bacterium]|nr:ABC transporter substrate-binding protein [Actinomycetota bacterium]